MLNDFLLIVKKYLFDLLLFGNDDDHFLLRCSATDLNKEPTALPCAQMEVASAVSATLVR